MPPKRKKDVFDTESDVEKKRSVKKKKDESKIIYLDKKEDQNMIYYHILGSKGNIYIIQLEDPKLNPFYFSCRCPAYLYSRGKLCKHILFVKDISGLNGVGRYNIWEIALKKGEELKNQINNEDELEFSVSKKLRDSYENYLFSRGFDVYQHEQKVYPNLWEIGNYH